MYATQQDIIDRYDAETLLIIADSDLDGEPDAAKVALSLSDASDEVDIHIGKRYPLPLVTVPKVLTRLTVDIAVYFLSAGTGATDERRVRYEDAINLLKSLAAGKVSLGLDADTSDEASPVSNEVEVTSNPRLFDRNNSNRIF